LAYIGTKPTIGNFQICDPISVVNGQAAYTMQVGSVNVIPQSSNHMIVSLNGTIQKPGGTNPSFTVSGSTITFASNLATGDVIDFIQILGDVLDLGVPSDATVTTAKLADSAVTAAKITDSTITAAKLASGTVQNQSAFKNIIINGDMSLAQRATSTASITSNGYYTVDRFQTGASSLGTWTQSQSTDVPTGQGFAKSLKMDCTTADASPSASDKLFIRQKIEGQNLQYLKKGTSSAESLTLSFWVKSNKTGTYIAELNDTDNTRTISKSYTISSADTWEKKTITFAGDTSGTLNNDNANSLECTWYLGVGSNFTSGTLQTDWGSQVVANRAVGQVNLADSTSNEWYVTGVQLETGTSASDFEFLPVDINLARCQRYFEKTLEKFLFTGSGNAADRAITLNYTVQKRATPTVTFSDITVDGGGTLQVQTFSNAKHLCVEMTGGSGGRQFFANYKSDAEL
jgi:hypothetical protein